MAEEVDINYLVTYGQDLLNNSLLGDPTAIVILAGIAIVLLALVFGVSALVL